MLRRALPLLLAATTGCFPTYRHSVADAMLVPPKADRGSLDLITTEGERIRFDAPYAVDAGPNALSVTGSLTPRADYDATRIDHLETTDFNAGGTILVAGGVLTAAEIAFAVYLLAGGFKFNLLANWPR